MGVLGCVVHNDYSVATGGFGLVERVVSDLKNLLRIRAVSWEMGDTQRSRHVTGLSISQREAVRGDRLPHVFGKSCGVGERSVG